MRRFKNIMTLTALRLVASAVGFLRSVIVTQKFGIGAFSDAYYMMLTIINVFGSFCSAMSNGILLPIYNDQSKEDLPDEVIKHKQNEVLFSFLIMFHLGMFLVSLVFLFFSRPIAELYSANISIETVDHLTRFFRITVPISLLTIPTGALVLIILQRKQYSKLQVPEIMTGLLYVALFIVLFPYFKTETVVWLYALTQSLLFFYYLFYVKIQPILTQDKEFYKKVFRLVPIKAMPWIVTATIPIIDTWILSSLPTGQLSIFRFSGNIAGVFAGLTISTLQLTNYPALMLAGSKRDRRETISLLKKSFKEGLLLYLPLAVMAYFLAPVVLPLFLHQRVTGSNTVMECVHFFRLYLWVMPMSVAISLLNACYNSWYLNRIPIIITYCNFPIRVLAASFATYHWQLIGFMTVIFIDSYLQFIIYSLCLRYKLRKFEAETASN